MRCGKVRRLHPIPLNNDGELYIVAAACGWSVEPTKCAACSVEYTYCLTSYYV